MDNTHIFMSWVSYTVSERKSYFGFLCACIVGFSDSQCGVGWRPTWGIYKNLAWRCVE